MCTELIECKRIVSESKDTERLRSINSSLNKTEELLEVYRSLMEVSPQKVRNYEENDVQKLKETCLYQEKTIEFLRKNNQQGPQFN